MLSFSSTSCHVVKQHKLQVSLDTGAMVWDVPSFRTVSQINLCSLWFTQHWVFCYTSIEWMKTPCHLIFTNLHV
jgi:hypothetical protein